MNLAQYFSALHIFSRKQSARLIKKWYVTVNDDLVLKPTFKINEGDIIRREGQELIVKLTVTLLINKPAWYISSDEDEYGRPSYKQLLDGYVYAPLVHIAWRLDVDTEGLIIASSDGKLIHRIISPRHHLPKTYLVTTRDPVTDKQLDILRSGVILDDGYKTLPAQATKREDQLIELILTEGKYHQVKRMLASVGNEVVHLQRVAIGPWTLDDVAGKVYRELSGEEVMLALSQKTIS